MEHARAAPIGRTEHRSGITAALHWHRTPATGALTSVPTWAELGYQAGTYETWRAVVAPKGITPAQVAYWEEVMHKVADSEEFRKNAEKNQADVAFKGAADTRKHMEAEYEQARSVLNYLGLVK